MNKYKLEFTIGKTKHSIADKSIEAILNRIPTTGTKFKARLYKNISDYTENPHDHLRYDHNWNNDVVTALEDFGVDLEKLHSSIGDNVDDDDEWADTEDLYY